MRILLILVCTISLMTTGCKTGTKKVTCGSVCCGCGVAHVGTAEQTTEVADASLEQEALIETVHAEQSEPSLVETINPFESLASAEETESVVLPEYAHGKNHEWLVGQLQRIHTSNHEWKLRYSPLDVNEKWGGSVILAPDARLDQWRDGDVVYVEGEILSERPSLYLAGPLYRARIIRPASETPRFVAQHRE